MRNAFVKRLAAVLLALCLLAALPITGVFADEAKKTYTVTFSGGEYGVFSQAFVQGLYGYDGVVEVKTAEKDGKIVTVAVKVEAGATLPAAPAITAAEGGTPELSSSNTAYGVLNAGTESGQNDPTGLGIYGTTDGTTKKVDRNYTLVPEFYLASDNDVEYMVRFLATGTDTEVAPTQFGKAPDGARLTMTAASVDEYTLDLAATREINGLAADDALVLNVAKGEEMPVFTFCYTQVTHVNTEYEYVDGDTIVNYNDVTLTGGAGVAGGGGAGGGAGAGEETLPDEETPQAGGETIPDESTPQAGGEDIAEEETPQAEPAAAGGLNLPLMIGGAVVLVLAILLLVLAATRKRRAAEGDEE